MAIPNPVPGYSVTNKFGPRKSFEVSPGVWTLPYHYGEDRAAPTGTPVVASLEGTVSLSAYDNDPNYERLGITRWPGLKQGLVYGAGWWVIIKSPGGVETRYMHLRSRPLVRKGDKVKAGEVIGYIGSTGVSTGPHLHQEVVIKGRFTNPSKYKISKETAKEAEQPLPDLGGSQMFMIRKSGRYAVVGPNFWLEFGGKGASEAASNILAQITGDKTAASYPATESMWKACKEAATKGSN